MDENHFPGGCSSIQADGSIKVSVPKHGASQQSDQKSNNEHQQQSDEPAQHRYTRGTGQVPNITPTLKRFRKIS